MAEPIISIENLSVDQKDQNVLKSVNLSVNEGDFIYLIGKTGSGKSSLLKILYADLKIKSGKVNIGGIELSKLKRRQIPTLRRKMGIIFQDFQLLPDRTVQDNLIFAMKATGWNKKSEIKAKLAEIFELINLQGKENKYPHQLSGGEQQRVAIGRALINSPKVILADEPTGNLDPQTSIEIMNLLFDIRSKGTAVLMATHDYMIIDKFPSDIVRFENGEAKPEHLTSTNQ